MPVYMMITSIMGITISLILLLTSSRTKDSISYLVNLPGLKSEASGSPSAFRPV